MILSDPRFDDHAPGAAYRPVAGAQSAPQQPPRRPRQRRKRAPAQPPARPTQMIEQPAPQPEVRTAVEAALAEDDSVATGDEAERD